LDTLRTPKDNFGVHMSKIKFVKNPRSIIRKRHDHPTSLFVTIPKNVVKEWELQTGQIVEFTTLAEGREVFLKVRKVAV
jgi:hypothetical protein